ncbi:MAG: bifunctional protein-serine/threonine kinase/phosphatase [Verrucomicrobiota bacterium]
MKIRSTTFGMAGDEAAGSSDAFSLRAWDETVIAVLSDGAGSGQPAREAARRAVELLAEQYGARPRIWSPQRALLEFTRLLNDSLYQESQARFGRNEMVATLAVVAIEGDELFGLNLGNSRVCLWRNGALQTLSIDHIDASEPPLLTRALGLSADVEPHVFSAKLEDGDLALLCSDGVSNHLAGAALMDALKHRTTAQGLVRAARQLATRETMDDMSAIVLDIQQTGRLRTMTHRSLPVPAELKKGDKFDGCELLRAFQGTDRVWLAEKDGQRVVCKFAPVEAADSEAHLDAFTRETWNAMRMPPEHFVRAYEPADQTLRYYLMDFVDAPNLRGVLQERLLPVDSAVALGRFLAQACQILLQLDLAHGDIKPENILCIGDYAELSFKLVDLGCTAPLFTVASRAGSASYLAPERFHGAPISERTELFAIGVTLYQSLSGTLPYGEIERFQTPVFATAKRVSSHNSNVPPWLDTVIARAIAIDPDRRYQNYSELMFDLANPSRVQPFFAKDTPLLLRNPLAFYKCGFFLLLALLSGLLLYLLTRS